MARPLKRLVGEKRKLLTNKPTPIIASRLARIENEIRALRRKAEPKTKRWKVFATRTGKLHSANKVVQRKLWPILDTLGIPRAGFHAFRYAASTFLIALGATAATVQDQLGHSDTRITLSAYTQVVDKSQRDAVERLAEILIPKRAKTVAAASTDKWIQ